MKSFILIVCVLFFGSTFTYGQSEPQTREKTPKAKTAKSGTEGKQKGNQGTDEFHALVADYYKAWNTLNLSAPAKYYSQTPGLVFYDLTPLQYKGWKEYQTGVGKLFQDFESFKLLPNDDLAITRRGKLAWTTMTLHISGKQKKGSAMELDARHTAIWEKAKGKWLIVHEHISVPLPASAAAK